MINIFSFSLLCIKRIAKGEKWLQSFAEDNVISYPYHICALDPIEFRVPFVD
jgi:hypothetical protein